MHFGVVDLHRSTPAHLRRALGPVGIERMSLELSTDSAPDEVEATVAAQLRLRSARACLSARPFVYALGAGAEPGVRRAATILAEELRLAILLLGRVS